MQPEIMLKLNNQLDAVAAVDVCVLSVAAMLRVLHAF